MGDMQLLDRTGTIVTCAVDGCNHLVDNDAGELILGSGCYVFAAGFRRLLVRCPCGGAAGYFYYAVRLVPYGALTASPHCACRAGGLFYHSGLRLVVGGIVACVYCLFDGGATDMGERSSRNCTSRWALVGNGTGVPLFNKTKSQGHLDSVGKAIF